MKSALTSHRLSPRETFHRPRRLATAVRLLAVMAVTPAYLAAQRATCDPALGPFDAPRDAFDFLIGQWEVVASGKVVAEVDVEPALGGKVLRLVWIATEGSYEAHSFIGLDEAGRWSQTWVDASSSPFFLFYHGGLEGGVPTLYQTEQYHESAIHAMNEDSGLVCARQRFQREQDGTVVYLWEVSPDQGGHWLLQDRSIFRRRPA